MTDRDIVTRLREAAKMPKEKIMVDVALNEAADEIEKLRGEIEPLQKALEVHAHYAAEVERLRAQVVSLQSSLDAGPPIPGKKTPNALEKPE